MPLDASRNSLVLPLLGLLVEQPAHAYDLTTRLRERYVQLGATRSTVTTLLKAMERAGVVSPRAPERVGNRPPRTAYELTEAGLADFRQRVEAGLRETAVASLDFVLAVSYAGLLTAGRAVELLDGRATRLEEELAGLRAAPADVPEVHMLEVGYWSAVVTAELTWIRATGARIRAGDIDWRTA